MVVVDLEVFETRTVCSAGRELHSHLLKRLTCLGRCGNMQQAETTFLGLWGCFWYAKCCLTLGTLSRFIGV